MKLIVELYHLFMLICLYYFNILYFLIVIEMVVQFLKEKLFLCFQILVKYLNFLLLKFCITRTVCSEYDSDAIVYNILFRHKLYTRIIPSCKDDFIALVEGSADPAIILKENISLYCINENEAVLVDCGNEDIFDSSHHAFVYNHQFAVAVKLVCVPLSSFHKVVTNVTLPKIPIVHLPNHGRCGSTLLTKLFEAIPGSLSISETSPLTDLALLSQSGIYERGVLRKICFSIIMCTVKHCHSRKSKLLFLKFQNVVTYVTDIMMEAVPEIKHIYMYRQPVPFVRSWEKIIFVNKWELADEMYMFWSGLGWSELLKDSPNHTKEYIKELSFFARIALLWITGVAAFNRLITNGCPIKSLKYEDMLHDPRKTLMTIFRYVNIDEDMIPDIDLVMSKDSQHGTEFSTRFVDKKKMESSASPITNTLTNQLNELCEDFDVPLFWNDVQLNHSII